MYYFWNNIFFVDAGENALMFFRDGSDSYIYNQNLETTRSLYNKWREKYVFPPESAFVFCRYFEQSTFPYFVFWLGV